MIRDQRDMLKLAGGAVGAAIIAVGLAQAVKQNRHELDLLVGGKCHALTEALYTPLPRAHSSCRGDADHRYCSTYYTQSDPYLRTLYRCTDPDRGGKQVEFWRRSTDEANQ
jgi:hypothetical protein